MTAVVLVVRTDDAAAPGIDRDVAAHLVAALERRGHVVQVLPWYAAHRGAPAELFLSLAPGTDPAWAPPGAVTVGWAVDDVARWTSFGHLIGFDRVLAASPSDETAVRAATPRGVGVLAPSGPWDETVARLEELVAGADRLPAAPQHPVHFFPNYRPGNPYQVMLHSALGEVDAYDVPVRDLGVHLRRRRDQGQHGGDPGLLAMHWTAPVLHDADGPFRARLLLDRFISDLDGFLEAGGRLVWTVHNVLPHEVGHRWAELELAQVLADRAEVVHVLSEESLVELRHHFRIPADKVVVIEHSSYVGQYPEGVTRADARARLGLAPDAEVLLSLGGIRPYKGLDLLLDAVDGIAATHPDLRLLVAGRALEDPASDELRTRCEQDPRVLARFDHVPDDELQVWFAAADVAVLPYRGILNSGAFLLAQTFGVPVVAPRAGSLVASEGQPHVRLFDAGDAASLVSAVDDLLAAVAQDPAGLRALSRAAAERLSPARMGAAYARAIEPWLAPAGQAPPVEISESR